MCRGGVLTFVSEVFNILVLFLFLISLKKKGTIFKGSTFLYLHSICLVQHINISDCMNISTMRRYMHLVVN